MITKIKYNWFMSGSKDDEWGEDYFVHEVGKKGVVSISEHLPLYNADPHYCLVTFKDGHQERIMNLNAVISNESGF